MKKTTLIILIACAAALLAAGGFFLWRQKKPGKPVQAEDHGQIVSVRFSQGHMVRTECFQFFLEKKDEKYFLRGSYFNEQEKNVVLENQKVPAKTMDELCGLLREEKVEDFLKQYKAPQKKPHAQDETIEDIEIRWEDGTVLSADSHGSFGPALRRFFEDLCRQYEK